MTALVRCTKQNRTWLPPRRMDDIITSFASGIEAIASFRRKKRQAHAAEQERPDTHGASHLGRATWAIESAGLSRRTGRSNGRPKRVVAAMEPEDNLRPRRKRFCLKGALGHFLLSQQSSSWTTSPPTRSPAYTSAIDVAVGATPLYLPPYSPDLNPIEQVFAKLKAITLIARETEFLALTPAAAG